MEALVITTFRSEKIIKGNNKSKKKKICLPVWVLFCIGTCTGIYDVHKLYQHINNQIKLSWEYKTL